MKQPRIGALRALANTLELDFTELSDYQYQAGRFSRSVYAIGEQYFCVGKRPPSPLRMSHLHALQWALYPDQFWAGKANTIIWVASQP